jgi:phosphoribosylpyrophosphate synthetase
VLLFLVGRTSAFLSSVKKYANDSGINFYSVHESYHLDRELKITIPDIKQTTARNQDESRHYIVIQSHLKHDTYVSALNVARFIRENMIKPKDNTCLTFCCPYLSYARNKYLLKILSEQCNRLVAVDIHDTSESNRLFSKLPQSEFLEEDAEHRSKVHPNVYEHSIAGSTYQEADFREFQKSNIYNLYPAALFAQKVSDLITNFSDVLVVAPDAGAQWRARKLAQELLVNVVIATKTRCKDGSCNIEIPPFSNKINTAVIVDDIISSGATIKATLNVLKQRQVGQVILVVAHILSGNIADLCREVDAIITTDIFDHNYHSSKNIYKVHMAKFIVDNLINMPTIT